MTKQNCLKMVNVFSEGELILLEDALNAYLNTHCFSCDSKLIQCMDLRDNVVFARRFSHQLGKTQR
jgi:hypothetical protein